MGFWELPVTGVVIGGAITTVTQVSTQLSSNWRDGRKASRAAEAQAKAERDALQIRTITDLQDQIEGVSVVVGAAIAKPAKLSFLRAFFAGSATDVPDLTSFSRAVMLCSRLDDRELAEMARKWLKDMRIVCTATPFDQGAYYALRDRRIVFQDRLGEKLLSYYE